MRLSPCVTNRPRALVVERRLVEGARQCPALRAIERGTIEPKRMKNWGSNDAERPLPSSSHENEPSSFSCGVVPGEEIVACGRWASPSVQLVFGMRKVVRDFCPPLWRRGPQVVERKHLIRNIRATLWDVELDGKLTVRNGKDEAACVESRTGERGHGPLGRLARVAAYGVDGRAELALAAVDESACD